MADSKKLSLDLFLLHPHENQSKVLGYQGWDKILMIILVSSQKSPTPNISAASVTKNVLSDKEAYNRRGRGLLILKDNLKKWVAKCVSSYLHNFTFQAFM